MDALAMDLDTAEREVATEEVTEVHRSKAVSPEVDETLDLVVEIIAVEEAEGLSCPTKVGLLLAMMTLIPQLTSTSSNFKRKKQKTYT